MVDRRRPVSSSGDEERNSAYVVSIGSGPKQKVAVEGGAVFDSPEAAYAAGYQQVGYDAETGKYREVKGGKNEADFVALGDFPDETFANIDRLLGELPDSPHLEFPTIEQQPAVNPIASAATSMLWNLAAAPILSGQATQLSLSQAEAINEFQFKEYDRYMSEIMPSYDQIVAQESEAISAFLAGELPPDVREQVAIQAAQTANAQGVGMGGRAANIQARDLGIASTELVASGLDYANQSITRNQNAASWLMADTDALTQNAFNMLGQGGLLTPSTVIDTELANNAQRTNVDMFNAQGISQTEQFNFEGDMARYNALYATTGMENNLLIESATWDYQNDQAIQAANRAYWERQRMENASSGIGGTLGAVVGGVAGTFFGMPTLGAAVGGALGGAIDPATGQSGLEGAVAGGIGGGANAAMIQGIGAELAGVNWNSFFGAPQSLSNASSAAQNFNAAYPVGVPAWSPAGPTPSFNDTMFA